MKQLSVAAQFMIWTTGAFGALVAVSFVVGWLFAGESFEETPIAVILGGMLLWALTLAAYFSSLISSLAVLFGKGTGKLIRLLAILVLFVDVASFLYVWNN